MDEVYRFVRTRTHLATGDGAELWQNVMLYKDDRPDVEVGVQVSGSFEPEGRVTASAERSRGRPTVETTPDWA